MGWEPFVLKGYCKSQSKEEEEPDECVEGNRKVRTLDEGEKDKEILEGGSHKRDSEPPSPSRVDRLTDAGVNYSRVQAH
jgi:hypothetical protein